MRPLAREQRPFFTMFSSVSGTNTSIDLTESSSRCVTVASSDSPASRMRQASLTIMPCTTVAVRLSHTCTGTLASLAAISAELAVPESAVAMWMESTAGAPSSAILLYASRKAVGEGCELCGSSSVEAILS